MTPEKPITITVEMTPESAQALAQFMKRVGWSEMRQNAINDAEAYEMRDALLQVRKSLQEVGFDPR
jgi:ABC-type phosphate/phosphonate transport system substrate-binding protein